ncbi:hypothetical protein [Dyadobacter aurulentus]|nr:hypothetical protein [Dyadobacter sp. UC 10]
MNESLIKEKKEAGLSAAIDESYVLIYYLKTCTRFIELTAL